MQENELKELFATILNESPEAISDETRPADLERWDSLQHMILVSSFEEELGLDIEPEEAVAMYQDFGSFKKSILRKMNGSA